MAAALQRLGLPLSISHRILPEFREYERASTVVANAYLAPKMGAYLTNLATSVESGYEACAAGGDAVFRRHYLCEALRRRSQ